MSALWERLRATARLMVGQPPYDAYLAHMARHHDWCTVPISPLCG